MKDDVYLNSVVLPPLMLIIIVFAICVSSFIFYCDNHHEYGEEDEF